MLSGRLAQAVQDSARLVAGAGLVFTQSVRSLPGFKPLLEGDVAGAARAALKSAADTAASVVGATAGRVRDAAPEFTRGTENVTRAAEGMGRQASSTADEMRSQVDQVMRRTTTDAKGGVLAGVCPFDPESKARIVTYRNQTIRSPDCMVWKECILRLWVGAVPKTGDL